MLRGLAHRLAEGMRKHPVIAGGFSAGVAIAALLGLNALLPTRGPAPEVSDAVIVQAIASGAVVLAAVLPGLLNTRNAAATAATQATAAAADAAVVREEVKNNHTTNFREDHDAHKDEILAAVAGLRDDVREDLREVRSDIRGLRKDGGRRDDRIHRIEDALGLRPMRETE